MTEAVKIPKAAQQLLDDAREAGYDAKITTHDSVGITVTIATSTGRNGSCTWTSGTFYAESARSTMLGFHVGGGRPGVRFGYAAGENPNPYRPQDRYPVLNSVRAFRAFIGLAI